MQTLGVAINVVAPLGASLDDLRRLPTAWVNLAPYRELGLKAAEHLEQQFGTPTLYDAPIGVQPTLRWLHHLVEQLNEVGARMNVAPIKLPPLTAFSLDGMSAPSGVPWFVRTADMESFSGKRAFVFGDATHTVGIVKFLRDELAMPIAGAGTYLSHHAAWMRQQLDGYLPGDLLVTDRFQEVTAQIEQLMPELVCGTQMERHSCRKLDLPCLVIAPPTHIENHLLSYNPMLGFDGADHIADKVYTTATLGLEKHLLDMFGDAGLTYNGSSLVGTQQAPEASGEENTEKPKVEPQLSTRPSQSSTPEIIWSPGAEAMLSKVPFFVRNRVRKRTEQFATSNHHSIITEDVLQAAKEAFGG
jgi:light-independent protochlorophyllide reductase subunit B